MADPLLALNGPATRGELIHAIHTAPDLTLIADSELTDDSFWLQVTREDAVPETLILVYVRETPDSQHYTRIAGDLH